MRNVLRHLSIILSSFGVLFWMGGCSLSSSGTDVSQCIPGQVVACACPGNASGGTQSCLPDRTLDLCICVEPEPTPEQEPETPTPSEPAAEPVQEPEPTEAPVEEPVAEPVEEPEPEPVEEPVVEPTQEPAAEPVVEPVVEPEPEPVSPAGCEDNSVNAEGIVFAEERSEEGLVALYLFEDIETNRVENSAPVPPSDTALVSEEELRGQALPGRHGVSFLREGRFRFAQPSPAFVESINRNNAVSIEAWIRPQQLAGQVGPARIMAYGYDTNLHTMVLGQVNDELIFRITGDSPGTGLGHTSWRIGTLESMDLHHVVCTLAQGEALHCFLNNEEQTISLPETEGDAAALMNALLAQNFEWPAAGNEAYVLSVGNDALFRRPWLGEVHLLALYDRVLSHDEIARHFTAGAGRPTPNARVSIEEDRSEFRLREDQENTSGTLVLHRAYDDGTGLDHRLKVYIALDGGAVESVDFRTSLDADGSVTFEPGEAFAEVSIWPVDDEWVEGTESIVATVYGSSCYSTREVVRASFTLEDNDVGMEDTEAFSVLSEAAVWLKADAVAQANGTHLRSWKDELYNGGVARDGTADSIANVGPHVLHGDTSHVSFPFFADATLREISFAGITALMVVQRLGNEPLEGCPLMVGAPNRDSFLVCLDNNDLRYGWTSNDEEVSRQSSVDISQDFYVLGLSAQGERGQFISPTGLVVENLEGFAWDPMRVVVAPRPGATDASHTIRGRFPGWNISPNYTFGLAELLIFTEELSWEEIEEIQQYFTRKYENSDVE